MSGPYFPYFMKEALGEAQEDIRRLLATVRGSALHKEEESREAVTLDDVPTIIKALEFKDPGIRELARETLAKLAGSDLGPTPDAWKKWWASQHVTVAHAKTRHMRIEEGRRLVEEEQDEPFGKKTTLVAKGISVASGILVAITIAIYIAQGRDPKIGSSCAFLGFFVGAIYGVAAAYVTLARSPKNRLYLSLMFLAGSIIISLLLHGG